MDRILVDEGAGGLGQSRTVRGGALYKEEQTKNGGTKDFGVKELIERRDPRL